MHKLASYVVREGALEPRDAVGWVLRVCSTIEPLHRAGRPHGRVSAKGLQALGPHCEAAGFLLDASEIPEDLAYQSPERLRGAGASAADDTWAAGVILYLLLTASLPFAGGTADKIRQGISRGAAPLAVFGVDDDDKLQPIIDVLFSTQPRDRLSWLGDLRNRLLACYASCIDLAPLRLGKPGLRIFDDEDDEDEGGHKLTAVVSRDALWGDVKRALAKRAAAKAVAAEDDDDDKPTEEITRRQIAADLRRGMAQAVARKGPVPPARQMPPAAPAPRAAPAPPTDPNTPSTLTDIEPPPSSSWPQLGPPPSSSQPGSGSPSSSQPNPSSSQPGAATQGPHPSPMAAHSSAPAGVPSFPIEATVDDISSGDAPETPPPSSSVRSPPAEPEPRPWEVEDSVDVPDGGLRAWHFLAALVMITLGGALAYFVYRPPTAPTQPAPSAASSSQAPAKR